MSSLLRGSLLTVFVLGCTNAQPPAPTTPVKPRPKQANPAPPVAPLIAKMQAINAAMETLIRALKESDQTRANQAALQIASLSKSIDPNKDHRSDYGKDFAGLVKDLQQAATAMTQAVADNSKAPQALRHLHDQCLRCHDQAPAAASVGVCQLTQ